MYYAVPLFFDKDWWNKNQSAVFCNCACLALSLQRRKICILVEKGNKIISFIKAHPIIFNMCLIVVAFFVVCYAALYALDLFTEHGKTLKVPDVRNLQLADAVNVLHRAGFNCEVTDSLYNDRYNLGAVVEQSPKANADAKSKRTIYVSVNYSTPRTITLPNLADYSERQGLSMLQGLGFNSVEVSYVPSPYKGLIIDVLVDGRQMEPGTKVLPSVGIELRVGDGNGVPDSIASGEDDFIDPYAEDSDDIFL